MIPPDAPRRRWLVDGMNVIGSRPDGWWRDRTAAMRRLTGDLDALARETGEPVTVLRAWRSATAEPASDDPQAKKNLAPSTAASPHLGHAAMDASLA